MAGKYKAGARAVKSRVSDVSRSYGTQTAVLAKSRPTVTQLAARLARTEAKVRSLERELAALRTNGAVEDVVVLRQVDRGQAKREIRELFQRGETLYYSEIADRLRLDIEVVVEVCRELMDEGEIEVHAKDAV
jgi:Mn-dependent DtxR family transcriptional regulator